MGLGEGATHTHGRDALVNTASRPGLSRGTAGLRGQGSAWLGVGPTSRGVGQRLVPFLKYTHPLTFGRGFAELAAASLHNDGAAQEKNIGLSLRESCRRWTTF